MASGEQHYEDLNNRELSFTRTELGLKACLAALVVVFLIFSVYEVVERQWFGQVELSRLHLFHIMRGIGSSVIVAVIVAWYVLSSRPFVIPARSSVLDFEISEDEADKEQMLQLNNWFIRLRWIACLVAATLTILTIEVFNYLDRSAFWPLVILIGCLLVSNVLYRVLLWREWQVQKLPILQIVADLIILTAMLHFSGGIENPLSSVYVFHVIFGGILLDKRRCYLVVAVAYVLFASLALAEMTGFWNHYSLLVFPHPEVGEHIYHVAHRPLYVGSLLQQQLLLLVLTAYFSTTMADRLRREEKRARADRQRLLRVVEATGSALAVLDKNLRPVWLNKRMKQWLSHSGAAAEKNGTTAGWWIGGIDGPARETFLDGKVRMVERRTPDKQKGEERFFQVTVAPLFDGSGNVYQLVEHIQDITHRKVMEAEMMHSAKMAGLGFMAAGIAHEINNPLASISTRLCLLAERQDPAFLQESLPLLRAQISRIERIVRGVSQLARPSGQEWSDCRINQIVKETCTMLRLHRLAKDRSIEVAMARNLPVTMGVRDQLMQVFSNLGINALEAMSPGGVLSIKTFIRDNEIGIEFADTGNGMEMKVRSKIFKPFFTTKNKGLGIGLYFVKSIVDGHNGRIEVRSVAQKTSVFTVFLPVRKPEHFHKWKAGVTKQWPQKFS